MLNANLQNSIAERKRRGIQLYLTALAMTDKKDDYSKDAVNKLVSMLHTDKVRALP